MQNKAIFLASFPVCCWQRAGTGFLVHKFFVFFSVRLLSVPLGHSFFHPRHNSQWPPTSKDFYPRFYPLHFNPILILQKEPVHVFPFSMLSAKQGNYWYHLYNVFGMTRSVTGDWTRDLPHSSQHSTTWLSRRQCGSCKMNGHTWYSLTVKFAL